MKPKQGAIEVVVRRFSVALLICAGTLAPISSFAETIRFPNGVAIDDGTDISGTVMRNCPDVTYSNEYGGGSLYRVVKAFRRYRDIEFEMTAKGLPWVGQLMQDIQKCLKGPAEASNQAPPAAPGLIRPKKDTLYAPELTEQEKASQRDKVSEKASDDLLAEFGNEPTGQKGKREASARPQQHASAVGCVRIDSSGAGDFQNKLGNSCKYKITVSFCTVSGRGTGAFNCLKKNYGTETIAPGGSQAIMGAGVPDAGDSFRVLYVACHYPDSPIISGFKGQSLQFSCR